MRQTVTDRGIIFLRMHKLLTKSEVTPLELIPMKNFINNDPSTLTDAGNDLRNRIMRAHKFYLTLDKSKAMNLVKKPNGYLPGIPFYKTSSSGTTQMKRTDQVSLLDCVMATALR